MKIGLYTTGVPATVGGGFVLRDDIARTAIQLNARHQFELVTTPPEDLPPPPLPRKSWLARKRDWLKIAPTPPPPPLPGRPPLERFMAEVKNRKFDLLWFNHFNPIYTELPYVVNIFDLQHRLQPWFPEVSAHGQWEHREEVWAEGVRRAAIVTVGSQEAKEQLCHFYGVPLENVRVLPFPTPQRSIDIAKGTVTAPAKTDVRAKYGIKGEFLFYPAQFWSHKNHVNLLRALKLLRQAGRDISLVLTGADHGNRPYLEATTRDMGLDDLVHFCGFVPYEDILTFYREARALSYVSFFGPENLPPLEAMALECPVILSNIPGVAALHGDGPVLVEPRSPEDIARGIAFVLDNPGPMRDRVVAGKAVALRNNCKRYLDSFQDMLDEFETMRRCWP